MDDSVQIKQEPDIKVEPEDEVDTIEYEKPLNQVDETFSVKVEKVESDDDDETNNPWELFDLFGRSDNSNLFSFKANNVPKPILDANPMKAGCSSHMASHLLEESVANTCQTEQKIVHVKAENAIPVSELNATRSKPNTVAKPTEKSNIKPTTSSASTKQCKCSNCGYVSQSPSSLEIHMRKHTGERPFPCNSCDKRFSQKQNLKKHMSVHVNKDSMHCSGCLQIFASKKEKLIHDSMHKRPCYECFLCRVYSTSNIRILRGHMRIHSGVRPFQCAHCSVKFTQKHHLKDHMKIHSHQPKPRCSVCARNFRKESERDAHEMNCKRRRYECYLCQSYMTYNKINLQYHMRMRHTGERPFICTLCIKSYATESDLKCHIKKSHKQ